MSNSHLRVIRHDPTTVERQRERELDQICGAVEARTVAIPLGKVVPLLLDAGKHQRAWLDDFADDLVHINSDLYEVLLAYQQIQSRAVA